MPLDFGPSLSAPGLEKSYLQFPRVPPLFAGISKAATSWLSGLKSPEKTWSNRAQSTRAHLKRDVLDSTAASERERDTCSERTQSYQLNSQAAEQHLGETEGLSRGLAA